ncbi:MAG: basic secretory protein-like protein, partial [Ignavibacteriaceae bacterium]
MSNILIKVTSVFIIFFCVFLSEAEAQYFGRNKVQYQNFNFEILKTEHFDLYFYPEEKEAVTDAAIMQENDHVLGHELVHAFQYNLIKSGRNGLRAAGSMPLWFIEGLAEYLSIGRKDALTAMWMRDAVLNNDVPDINDVSTNYKYFPYRYGQILWSYIASNYGDDIIKPLFESVIKNGWEKGFKEVLKVSQDSLSNMWRRDIIKVYGDQIKGKTKPSKTGKQLISGNGGMNLSPVISPDGNYIALFTREDLFTLNLYLADAHTGKLINELVSTNTDAHFDALRFMNSAGTWSQDGKYFAFVVTEDGNNQIAILDVDSKDISRKLNPGEVDAETY